MIISSLHFSLLKEASAGAKKKFQVHHCQICSFILHTLVHALTNESENDSKDNMTDVSRMAYISYH